MKRPRGTTLGTVVLVLSVSLFLTFTVASLGMFNSQLSTAAEVRDHAKNLAESAVAKALAQLAKVNSFGSTRAVGQAIQVHINGTPDDWHGFLSFNQVECDAEKTYSSSNYYDKDTPQAGSTGRTVPRNTIQLVGLGVCGSTRYQVECLYYKPPYPYGLGSSGKIVADDLLIGGLKSDVVFTGDYLTVAPDQKTPAHIFSNFSGATPDDYALKLGPNCDIRGNAGAVGNVTVDPSSTVEGEVEPYTYVRPIPDIKIDQIYTQISQAAADWSFSGAGAAPIEGAGDGSAVPFSGYKVLPGAASFAGDLLLNGCALFVDGDLTVQGTIRGTGMVLCRGNVTIQQGAVFDSTQSLALCAKGDINLHGAGRNDYFFHGLVYSEGDIHADGITVLGSVVANSKGNLAKGNLYLQHVAIHPGGGVTVFSAMGIPFDPLYLNTGASNDSGGNKDEDNDAMSLRVDGYVDASGTQKYNAYIWYGPDEDFLEDGGRNGYDGNLWLVGNNRAPIVIANVNRAQLEKQINITMHKINCDNENGGPPLPPLPTYMFPPNFTEPTTVLPAPWPPYPSPTFNMAHPIVRDKVKQMIDNVTAGTGPVISVDLNRVTPATERPRILLYRALP